jgi:hypothetical protein
MRNVQESKNAKANWKQVMILPLYLCVFTEVIGISIFLPLLPQTPRLLHLPFLPAS